MLPSENDNFMSLVILRMPFFCWEHKVARLGSIDHFEAFWCDRGEGGGLKGKSSHLPSLFWGWSFPFILVHFLSVFPSTQSLSPTHYIAFICHDFFGFFWFTTWLVGQIMDGNWLIVWFVYYVFILLFLFLGLSPGLLWRCVHVSAIYLVLRLWGDVFLSFG